MSVQAALFQPPAPRLDLGVLTTPEIDAALAADAAVGIGVSGGKDSCLAASAIRQHLRVLGHRGPVVLVHADLGRIEWTDSAATCQRLADRLDLELVTVRRQAGDMIARWQVRWENNVARYHALRCVRVILPWSTPTMRFCTSELKTAVICSELARRFRGQAILSATGIRRQESPKRKHAKVCTRQPLLHRPSFGTRGWNWNAVLHWLLDDVLAYLGAWGFELHEAYREWDSTRLSCMYCLAGETEVVTRNGVRPIRELAGGRHWLLVPKRTHAGALHSHGHFVEVGVGSFGVQPLWSVTLRRGRTKRTIYATAEHRWMAVARTSAKSKRGYRRTDTTTLERFTRDLQPGDRLRALHAHPLEDSRSVPFAIAQGFVFGDGTKGSGERPATLTIYNNGKDEALLPFFAAHETRRVTANGQEATYIYGLPRLWKEAPDLRESRSFLLSWLAGYFAADGCVTSCGSARLDSARRENIALARDIAAICGVGYSPIRSSLRLGFGTTPAPLYSIVFDTRSLPDWFFVQKLHRERIQAHAVSRETDERLWTVEAVESTNRVEEVFCAVVPGVHAFALSEGLMTGNCIMSSLNDLRASARAAERHPHHVEVYRLLVDLEIVSGFSFQSDLWLGDVAPHLLAEAQREGLVRAKALAARREQVEGRIPEHLLYVKGWPVAVPSLEEATLLGDVRAEVAALYGWTVPYVDGADVRGRYEELIALRDGTQGDDNDCDEDALCA